MSKKISNVVLLVSATEKYKAPISRKEAQKRSADGLGKFAGRGKLHEIQVSDFVDPKTGKAESNFEYRTIGRDGYCASCRPSKETTGGSPPANEKCKIVGVSVFKLLPVPKLSKRTRRPDHSRLIRLAEPTIDQIERERRELAASPAVDKRVFCKEFSDVDAFVRHAELELVEARGVPEEDSKLSPLELAAWRLAKTRGERIAIESESRKRAGTVAEAKLFNEWRDLWKPQLEMLATDRGRLRQAWPLVGKVMKFLRLEFRFENPAWMVCEVEDQSVRDLPGLSPSAIEEGEMLPSPEQPGFPVRAYFEADLEHHGKSIAKAQQTRLQK